MTILQGQVGNLGSGFGNYCAQPHYPDDAVEHARQRRAQLKVTIPAKEEELAALKSEEAKLVKMLGALDVE